MRIEFDPTNPDEAAAVRAMLTAMHPQEWVMKTYVAKPVDAQALTEVGERIAETQQAALTDEPTTPELDSTGTPWDARIHSTPPTTNKDGTWRAKRGVKAEEIAAVRAEREALTVETYVELPDDTPSEKVAEAFAEVVSAAPTYAPESEPPQAAQDAKVETVTAPPAPPSPTPPVETFAGGMAPSFLDVMKAITAAQKDGKIDTAKVKELCAAVGAGESTMGLNGPDNGDKRGAFMALIGEVVS